MCGRVRSHRDRGATSQPSLRLAKERHGELAVNLMACLIWKDDLVPCNVNYRSLMG